MLGQRVLTAAVLAALFVPALFLLPSVAWIFVCALILGGCAWEWAGLSGLSGRAYPVVYAIGLVSLAAIATAVRELNQYWYIVATICWITLAPWMLWRRRQFRSPWISLALGIVVLVPAVLAMVDLRNAGPRLLLALMALIWLSDSSAYFAGRAFGHKRLAPEISPGKTWEGVYGALAGVLIYAIICNMTLKPLVTPKWLQGDYAASYFVVAFWLLLALAGVMGDLLESQLKRTAGVKDSGAVLPGHGGILDRVDALLPVLPAAALFYLR